MKIKLIQNIQNCLKEMRVHHCIKNFLIFAPLLFSGNFFNQEKFVSAVFAFVSFTFAASAVYIVNDICDIEKDRNNPAKRARPIASGAISIKSAWILFSAVLSLGFALSFLGGFAAFIIIFFYFILNLLYSFKLKNLPLVDICILVSGFFLRVLLGSKVTGVRISDWFYLTVISLSFCMAIGKRRGEILKSESLESKENLRKVLKFYTYSFLDKNMYVFITMANIFYALWAIEKKSAAAQNPLNFMFTIPLFILITLRYSFDVEGKTDGDPVEVLLHDKILVLLCFIYAFAICAGLYL